MQAHRVTIVIPAFNESEAIEDLVRELATRLKEAEIIVVDDGSTDGTGELAARHGVEVLRHNTCRGYGASLRTGVEAASRPLVLFCDADGQHAVDDVIRLIAEFDNCDMVVGARSKASHAPLVRQPGKFVMKQFANYLAGEKIPDLNSGLRIVKTDVLLRYIHLMPTGFSFSTTTTFAVLKGCGADRIKWVPISVAKRKGKSTVRQLRHGPQSLVLMLRLTVLFDPLKVFLAVATVLLLLTALSLHIDLRYGDRGIGDTTVLLSVSTLLVFLFGLICDQVSAIRREMHH